MSTKHKIKQISRKFHDYISEPESLINPGHEAIIFSCYLPKGIIYIFRAIGNDNYQLIDQCELSYFVEMNSKVPDGYIKVKDPETKTVVCHVSVYGMREYLETCLRLVAKTAKK